MTPFQYLKQNMHYIKFNCEPRYIPEYKRAFGAVLDKMDKYFSQNELYKVVDYQPIVESMLSSHKTFSFDVDIDGELSKMKVAGVHYRKPQGIREISLNKEYMGRGTTTEGVLCHEFIHYLTLGPEVLTYTKDGDRYETQLPTYEKALSIAGMKRNVTKRKVSALEAGSALDGGFICEAFTELLKQEIYTEEESFHAYSAQTSLIKLLNNLTGTKINIEDFLRGDLPNYVKTLGRENFNKFNRSCEAFQRKFNTNACIDYASDSDYLSAQDYICKNILENIQENPEQYSAGDYIRIASSIMTEAPVVMANSNYAQRYRASILSAGNAITRQQPLEFEEKRKYNKLLRATLDKVIQQKKGSFQIPSNNVDFSFKKTSDGFALNFKGGVFISSSQFPKHHSCRAVAKIGTKEISIELSEKGTYQITATEPNAEPQIIRIIPNKTNADELLIQDSKNADVFKLNFKGSTKKQERNIQENLSLLENFRHYDNIQNIMKANSENKIYNVKKVTAENGEEYLVANSNTSSIFYKITPNGYRRIDIDEQYTTALDTAISSKFTTGRDDSTSMFGYRATGVKTDEASISFKLADGTIFVRYYDEKGREQIGQQITPFRNIDSSVIVSIENPTLYSKSNEDIKDLMSDVTTSFTTPSIKRELLPQRDLEAERKVKEEQKRLREEEQRKKQEERDNQLQEERQNQKINREESVRRQSQIDRERRRQNQIDQEKEERFKRVEDKSREQGHIYDDFGIEISKIVEAQRQQHESSVDMGRGK